MGRVQSDDDEHAFAQLVRHWEGPIQRLCFRMTGDSHRAEDLTQEAFLRVFSKRKEYQPTAKFSTWLWRIALDLNYDELRWRHDHSELSLENGGGEEFAVGLDGSAAADPPPDRALAENERGEWVRRALLRLPETHRAVVVLRHYEGLKFREIADVLGLPEGTVKSRMADALAQMNRLLKPFMTDDPAPRPGTTGRPKESLIV